jgi:hypothetical protein
VDDVRKSYDAISADAPNVSDRLWSRSKQRTDKDYFLSNVDALPDAGDPVLAARPESIAVSRAAGEREGAPAAESGPVGGRLPVE